MSNLTSLRVRVEAVTKNLSELDHLEKDQSQRLHEALDHLRDSFRDKQAEIETKLDQIEKLTSENAELQKLLDEVLGFIERKDAKGFNEFLTGLDRKLGEIAALGSAEPQLSIEPLEPQAPEKSPADKVSQAPTLEVTNLLAEQSANRLDHETQPETPASANILQAAEKSTTAVEAEESESKSAISADEPDETAAGLAQEVKDSLNALEEAIYGSDMDEEPSLEQDAIAAKPEKPEETESEKSEAEIAELASLQPTYAEKRAEASESSESKDEDSSIFDILQRAHAVVRGR